MICLKFPDGIMDDYDTRDVFPWIRARLGSFHWLDEEQAAAVLSDAEYHADRRQFAPECRSLCRSYASLAKRLRAVTKGGGA